MATMCSTICAAISSPGTEPITAGSSIKLRQAVPAGLFFEGRLQRLWRFSQDEIGCRKSEIRAGENQDEVRTRVSVYIRLDERVPAAFVPGDAVGNDSRIVTCKIERLIALCPRGIDRGQIDDVDTVKEVDDQIRAPWSAVRCCREGERVIPRTSGESIRLCSAA